MTIGPFLFVSTQIAALQFCRRAHAFQTVDNCKSKLGPPCSTLSHTHSDDEWMENERNDNRSVHSSAVCETVCVRNYLNEIDLIEHK